MHRYIFRLIFCFYIIGLFCKVAFAAGEVSSKVYGREAGWEIYLSQYPDGSFSHCAVGKQYTDGQFFVIGIHKSGVKLGFGNVKWEISPGTVYPIYFQVDNAQPIKSEALLWDSGSVAFIQTDLPLSILNELKAAGSIYIHTEQTTLQFSLQGSRLALDRGMECFEAFRVLQMPTNPFVNDTKMVPENPFLAGPKDQSSANDFHRRALPVIERETFEKMLLGLLANTSLDTSNLRAKASEIYFAEYQAEIGNALVLYWEEESANVESKLIFSGTSSLLQRYCKGSAASKLAKEEASKKTARLHGFFACEKEDGDALIYSIDIVDTVSRAFVFLTIGAAEHTEGVLALGELLGVYFEELIARVLEKK